MKKNLVPLVGIAFVVAVVSTGIFYGLFAGKLRDASSNAPRQWIVVAARNIDRGAVLKKEDVKTVAWAGTEPLKGQFTNPAEVAGLTAVDNIQENEPLMQTRLASSDKGAGAGMGIPSGMRAVSLHVADSSGVMALLRPGHKIDIQVVGNRGGQSGEPELRTILQRVDVLAVANLPDAAQGRGPAPVVTVLATPAEADALGLADSAARIRITLRNPLDDARTPAPGLFLASLFRSSRLPREETPVRTASRPADPAPEKTDSALSLWVRIASAAPGAVEELRARLLQPRSSALLEVGVLRSDSDLENTLRRLEEKRQLGVLSSSYVQAGNHRHASVHASGEQADRACSVHIEFLPLPSRQGRLRLRVQPETVFPRKDGIATRRIETEVDMTEGQSFLVTGLLEPDARLIERLFPGQVKDNLEELLVVVTPKRVQPLQAAALHKAP